MIRENNTVTIILLLYLLVAQSEWSQIIDYTRKCMWREDILAEEERGNGYQNGRNGWS